MVVPAPTARPGTAAISGFPASAKTPDDPPGPQFLSAARGAGKVRKIVAGCESVAFPSKRHHSDRAVRLGVG